ncbi:MAG: CPBP family intramembrane glutamic endopeptidase [Candidatus Cyclobacteriaceae bacterium M3_2C_046]
MNKKTFILLALFTLFGFSFIGYAIIESWGNQSLADMLFSRGRKPLEQAGIGLAYGLLVSWLGWKLIETELLKKVRHYFSELIQSMELNISDIIFVSFCAGVGEEILFRGAIQPLMGLIPTSILFVAIHGYLNPMNWRLSVYGIFMTIAIIGIGYLKIHTGLISSIAAHTAIDIYLLYKLNHHQATQTQEDASSR